MFLKCININLVVIYLYFLLAKNLFFYTHTQIMNSPQPSPPRSPIWASMYGGVDLADNEFENYKNDNNNHNDNNDDNNDDNNNNNDDDGEYIDPNIKEIDAGIKAMSYLSVDNQKDPYDDVDISGNLKTLNNNNTVDVFYVVDDDDIVLKTTNACSINNGNDESNNNENNNNNNNIINNDNNNVDDGNNNNDNIHIFTTTTTTVFPENNEIQNSIINSNELTIDTEIIEDENFGKINFAIPQFIKKSAKPQTEFTKNEQQSKPSLSSQSYFDTRQIHKPLRETVLTDEEREEMYANFEQKSKKLHEDLHSKDSMLNLDQNILDLIALFPTFNPFNNDREMSKFLVFKKSAIFTISRALDLFAPQFKPKFNSIGEFILGTVILPRIFMYLPDSLRSIFEAGSTLHIGIVICAHFVNPTTTTTFANNNNNISNNNISNNNNNINTNKHFQIEEDHHNNITPTSPLVSSPTTITTIPTIFPTIPISSTIPNLPTRNKRSSSPLNFLSKKTRIYY